MSPILWLNSSHIFKNSLPTHQIITGKRCYSTSIYKNVDDAGDSEISKITAEVESLKSNLDISLVDSKKFHEFINGFFQAEGTSGVYFVKVDSLRVAFNFSIGHNYSKEAAILFLRLQVDPQFTS